MTKVDEYRSKLRRLKNWTPFLLRESGLPGPRGNIELAQAFCAEAPRKRILEYAAIGPDEAPENTPRAFLAFCGVMGLGKLIVNGDDEFARLRRSASDPRWRIREAVAMALQLVGDADLPKLLKNVRPWVQGNRYEQRGAAAGLCEPRLLRSESAAGTTLKYLDEITNTMKSAHDRGEDGFRTLRQGLAYCWSVAIAAAPGKGKPLFEAWLSTADPDIRWLLNQNLNKSRLRRMDAAWVDACVRRLGP